MAENIPTSTNNPGDLKLDGQPGATQGPEGFAQFPNPQEGGAALLNQIQTSINNKPNENLVDFSNTYAPPTDGNDPAQYAANLANQLGVSPGTPISQLQPQIGKFAEAIATNEGYQGLQSDSSQPSTPPTTPGIGTGNPNTTPTWEKLLAGTALVGLPALLTLAAPEIGLPVDAIEAATAGAATDAAVTGGEAVAGETAAGGGGLGGLVSNVASKIPGAIGTGIGIYGAQQVAGLVGNTVNQVLNPGSSSPVSGGTGTPIQDSSQALIQSLTASLPQAKNASNQINQGVTQTLQNSPQGAKMLQLPDNQQAIATGSMLGLSPLPDENNKVTTADATSGANKYIGQADEGIKQVLQAEGASGSGKEGIGRAGKYISKYIPDTQQDEASNYVKNTLETYKKKNGIKGDNIPLHVWSKIRTQEGHGRKWDQQESNGKRSGAKALSMAAREMMMEHSKHKDFLESALKTEKNLINYKKILKYLNEKKAPTHESFTKNLSHALGRYTALAIGAKIGGPMGAIVGDMVGNRIVKAVDKKYGSTIFDTPGMKKAISLVGDQSPAMKALIEREVNKAKSNGAATQAQLSKVKEATSELEKNKKNIKKPGDKGFANQGGMSKYYNEYLSPKLREAKFATRKSLVPGNYGEIKSRGLVKLPQR